MKKYFKGDYVVVANLTRTASQNATVLDYSWEYDLYTCEFDNCVVDFVPSSRIKGFADVEYKVGNFIKIWAKDRQEKLVVILSVKEENGHKTFVCEDENKNIYNILENDIINAVDTDSFNV